MYDCYGVHLISPAIPSLPYNHCVEVLMLMPARKEKIGKNLKHQVRSLKTERLRRLTKTLAVNVPFVRETTPWTIAKPLQERKTGSVVRVHGTRPPFQRMQMRKSCKTCAKRHPSSLHGDIRRDAREMTITSTQTSICHCNSNDRSCMGVTLR